MHSDDYTTPHDDSQDELERLILEGVNNSESPLASPDAGVPHSARKHPRYTEPHSDEEEDADTEVAKEGDLQGALGLFAESAQDLATAGVELGLGRHFACADFCIAGFASFSGTAFFFGMTMRGAAFSMIGTGGGTSSAAARCSNGMRSTGGDGSSGADSGSPRNASVPVTETMSILDAVC